MFFGLEVRPGHPYIHRSEKSKGRLRITMAALGLGEATSKSLLQVKIGRRSPIILCALFPERVESFPMHVEFFSLRKQIVFSVIGPVSIHISGYYPNYGRYGPVEEEPESCVVDMSVESEPSYDDETEVFSNSLASKSRDESLDKNKSKKKKIEGEGESSAPNEENNAFPEDVEDNKKIDDAEASNVQVEKKSKKKKKKNKMKSAEENSGEKSCSSKDVEDEKKKSNEAESSKVKSSEGNSGENKASVKDVVDEKKINARTLESGLVIEDLKPGESGGKVAVAGKEISVRYVCTLKSTGRIVDSNLLHNLLKFRLGARKVAEGWEDGVEGMRVGEKRRFTVPPFVGAIGKVREGENVPRDTWLVYDVELVKVKG